MLAVNVAQQKYLESMRQDDRLFMKDDLLNAEMSKQVAISKSNEALSEMNMEDSVFTF
jgi:hypothetical protein